MKSWINLEIPCPGCKFKTAVKADVPKLLEPSTVAFECDTCESILMAKISKPQKSLKAEANTVRLDVKFMKISATLVALMKEEAANRQGNSHGESDEASEETRIQAGPERESVGPSGDDTRTESAPDAHA